MGKRKRRKFTAEQRAETVIIEDRYCGPPRSGNGGYTCGVAARFVEGPAQVSLRAPAPLGKPLSVRYVEENVCLWDGDTLIATAQPGSVPVDPPPLPPKASLEDASRDYPGFEHHIFPTCFVCGPRREPGDGLRIFSGPLPATEMVGAPWIPAESEADRNGIIRPEIVWSALDCPGFFAAVTWPEAAVLGQLTAELRRPLHVGESCSVIGWPLGRSGRKLRAGTAIFVDDELVASAQALWIQVDAKSAGFV